MKVQPVVGPWVGTVGSGKTRVRANRTALATAARPTLPVVGPTTLAVMPSSTQLRAWVADRVTELEGLRDDVLIDMIMRRIEEDSDWDRPSFEASVSILMGERAQGFTSALWTFLGRNNGTTAGAPPPAATQPAQPTAAPLSQPVLDTGCGGTAADQGGGSAIEPQRPQATGGGTIGGYQYGEEEGEEDSYLECWDDEEPDDYDDPRYADGDDEDGEEDPVHPLGGVVEGKEVHTHAQQHNDLHFCCFVLSDAWAQKKTTISTPSTIRTIHYP